LLLKLCHKRILDDEVAHMGIEAEADEVVNTKVVGLVFLAVIEDVHLAPLVFVGRLDICIFHLQTGTCG
jgi:hypothetical protein